jgi:hypothetical protein
MFVLNYGTQYAIYAPYIQRIINLKTDMEFHYDGKHGPYHPHLVWAPAIPPAVLLLLWDHLLQLLLLLLLHVDLLQLL